MVMESSSTYADAFALTIWGLIDEIGQDKWLRRHPDAGLHECAQEARRRHGEQIARNWANVEHPDYVQDCCS